jgi:hypothetical protein
VANQFILWRRLDYPGHEWAQLFSQDSLWHLTGTALFEYERQPSKLDYTVICDSSWRTISGKVTGQVGDKIIDVAISVDSSQRWSLNGTECPQVDGCIDLDLNFSPSTNMLSIRRLNLSPGQSAEVRAAWIHFPSFNLEPLEQVYRPIDKTTYHYESEGGSFIAQLRVNDNGFVTDYPGLWELEAPV